MSYGPGTSIAIAFLAWLGLGGPPMPAASVAERDVKEGPREPMLEGLGSYRLKVTTACDDSQRYFDHDSSAMSRTEAARIAAVLPLPKERSVTNPSGWLRRHGRLRWCRSRLLRSRGSRCRCAALAVGHVIQNVFLRNAVVFAGTRNKLQFLHGNAFFTGNVQHQRRVETARSGLL